MTQSMLKKYKGISRTSYRITPTCTKAEKDHQIFIFLPETGDGLYFKLGGDEETQNGISIYPLYIFRFYYNKYGCSNILDKGKTYTSLTGNKNMNLISCKTLDNSKKSLQKPIRDLVLGCSAILQVSTYN
jgi:hypothetical protein